MIKNTFAKIFALNIAVILLTTAVFLLFYYFATPDNLILKIALEHIDIIVISLTCVFVISALVAYRVSKSVINPIIETVENFENIDNKTKYKELQPIVDTIKAQKRRQKLLDKQKKQFTANVSHELKTPLTSIAGYAELIESGIAKPEDIKPFANTIRKQALRLVSLAEDIIQLSQLEETENEIVFEEIDLCKIVKTCTEALEMNAKMKDVTLNVCAQNQCYIKGNASIIEEMVYNLCDNAIRYNKDNGIVDISVKQGESSTLLCVADTGIGIPAKYQERIFERFFRVDKSRSKETGGTGLGLAIVKHIAEVHNAKLTLESEENKGTTITVEFTK